MARESGKGRKLPLQKIINLGIVDHWFRGLSVLTPQHGAHDMPPHDDTYNFNRHILHHGTELTRAEIEKSAGFKQLVQSCSKNDVCVDISGGMDELEVLFMPERGFSDSCVFGNTASRGSTPLLRRNDNTPQR
jgi:hypothetical protein